MVVPLVRMIVRTAVWIDPLGTLTDRQPVDRTWGPLQVRPPHVEVDQRGGETLVTQQAADGQQVDARFQESRGVTVSQGVRSHLLVDPCLGSCQFAHFLNRGAGQRRVWRLAREKIIGRPCLLPIIPQLLQQPWRDGHESFFVPFAVGNADLHTLAVDVLWPQMSGFAQSQPRRVADQ